MDARHYISQVLSNEMTRLGKGEISLEQFEYLIDALEAQSFVPEHKDFFPAVRELGQKVKNKDYQD